MEAIETYLNNVFAAFPQTQAVLAMKREMLADLEEKYLALKREGKSENEAVGSVITNFGNIDEIAAELGLATDEDNAIATEKKPDPSILITQSEALAYLNNRQKFGRWIGFSVWLILVGAAIGALLDKSLFWGGNSGIWINATITTPSPASLIAFFIALVIAIPIFIVCGINSGRFSSLDWKRYGVRLDATSQNEVERQCTRFMPHFTIAVAIGVTLIFLSLALLALLSFIVPESSAALPVALAIFIIACAIGLIIIVGITRSTFKMLLGTNNAEKVIYAKSERIIGTIASTYWPLMVVIYLLWSFIFDAWSISWLLWPIAGIIFGGIAGGISSWHDTKEK